MPKIPETPNLPPIRLKTLKNLEKFLFASSAFPRNRGGSGNHTLCLPSGELGLFLVQFEASFSDLTAGARRRLSIR